MTEELKLIEGILAHAEDEKTNRSWAADDVGWENMDAIWHKAEQLKELLKKQEAINPIINENGEVCCGDCRFQLPILYIGNGEYSRKIKSIFCCQCGRMVKWE